ncbi:unnamed protein product [Caenorhabditis angaria]|uniref:Uncharacterized protein n=1 Tax=Caenorhabditis angaria TaxID=860376 RepID=A0A9P1J072_9PELO|nr:unnamed protein product [Caenorhabditis angaria]
MTENQGFVHEESTEAANETRKKSVDIGTSTTQVIIESEPPTMQSRDCWNRTCDVFGTRQAEYINQLRPIRSYLIRMQEALKIFQYELERDLKTKQSSKYCYQHVKNCVLEINHLCMHGNLNIPPSENEMLRAVAYELSLLARIIQEVAVIAQEKPRSRSHSFTQLVVVSKNPDTSKNEEGTSSSSDPGIAPVDQESLKNKITKTFDLVENLIKYIDKKTERRWWLRDVINFMQAAVKIALFISAAISVAYHENQIAPIVTLIITCIQGITEGMDQYFLKNKNADEIHISLLTSNTANKI